MLSNFIKGRDLSKEFSFRASRSRGPGGQNVNKLSTKVELRIHLKSSQILTPEEIEILLDKLQKKINNEGELILVSQTERTQLKNKEKVIAKFYSLMEKALTPKKKRKPTQPSNASKAKRIERKRIRSEQKTLRKGIDYS